LRAEACGVEHWAVKTLQDRPQLLRVQSTTLAHLDSVLRPASISATRLPSERHVYRVIASAPPPPPSGGKCAASYPTVCIPPPPPDLNCGDIRYRNFHVRWDVADPDPHHFDGDHDGIGCET